MRKVLAVLVAMPLWRSADAALVYAQVAGAERGISPEAKRVLDTYADLMQALQASMAAGGRPTERMSALESVLAEEVKIAETDLLAIVRTGDRDSADAAAYTLGYAPDPGSAVAALLDGIGRFDGSLTNNVGLALERLCRAHPDTEVPVARLTQALRAPEWNRQQKVAQVFEVLAARGTLKDTDGMLTAVLIPMLASQRQRVFRPAREILPRITGQSLGDAADRWAAWYAQTYGRTVDLAAGVYELVQIVHPMMKNGNERYRVDTETYMSPSDLVGRLKENAATAHSLQRAFTVVIQVPPDGFPQDRLFALLGTIFEGLQSPGRNTGLTVSPESDEFVPFAVALTKLQQLLHTAAAGPGAKP